MAQANRNNSNLSAPSVNANKFKVQVGVVSHLLIAVVFILSMMGTATAEGMSHFITPSILQLISLSLVLYCMSTEL